MNKTLSLLISAVVLCSCDITFPDKSQPDSEKENTEQTPGDNENQTPGEEGTPPDLTKDWDYSPVTTATFPLKSNITFSISIKIFNRNRKRLYYIGKLHTQEPFRFLDSDIPVQQTH